MSESNCIGCTKVPIDSDKAPKVRCFFCGGRVTRELQDKNYEKLKAEHEEQQAELKKQKEEEKKREKENRKKSESSNSNVNRPPSKKEIQSSLKRKAKEMARESGPKTEEISLIEPMIISDDKKKIRMSGKCPNCSQQVNSYIKKEKIPRDILDTLGITNEVAPEKPKEEKVTKKEKRSKKQKTSDSSSEKSSDLSNTESLL